MLRIKFVLTSLCAVVAVGAFASASASAVGRVAACVPASEAGKGQWNNNECTVLGGSKEFETKELTSGELTGTGGESTLEGELLKEKIVITCTKNVFSGEIKAAGAAEGTVTYEGCSIGNSKKETFKTCEVPNIKFKFKSQIIEEASELRNEFKGTEAEGRFVNIKINNKGEEKCLEKGSFPVKGVAIALVPNPDVFKLAHLFDFCAADGGLTFNGSPAVYIGSVNVDLLRLLPLPVRDVWWDILR